MAEGRVIRSLGEVALVVQDLERMQAFYEQTVGLELMRRFPDSAFFRIAPDYGGHTQILALFVRPAKPVLDVARSTLDHLAFTIDLADYESEKARLEGLGLKVRTREFDWSQWRSLFVSDPEGNTVELVCFDPSIGQG